MLTLYRLGHDASFNELEDIFGVSIPSACKAFNKTICVLVATMYDEYVWLPTTDEEWEEELRVLIENYGFPCI